jgi:hypothetical protein
VGGGGCYPRQSSFILGYSFINTVRTFYHHVSELHIILTPVQVSNAYLQFLQGSGIKMLLDFTKEMPKQGTRPTFDFSAVAGPLFFEWVVALLFPV